MAIRKYWYATPHLPLLVNYTTCAGSPYVDKLIIYRYGLNIPYIKKLDDKFYDESPLWIDARIRDEYSTNIITLKDLFAYIYFNKKGSTATLPNGLKCNVSKLFDYISISYLATYDFLIQNGVYPSDMHFENIFIRWFISMPDFENRKATDFDHLKIIYKKGGKFYKIETFGFAIVLGDLGTSIVKLSDKVVIAGQAINTEDSIKAIEQKMAIPNYDYHELILAGSTMLLTEDERKETVAYEIANSKPYCSHPIFNLNTPINLSFIKKLKSPIELLNHFYYKKYGIPEPQNIDEIIEDDSILYLPY